MKTYSIILILILSGLAGIGLVTVLYISSEEEIKRNNAFVRRYPPHPAVKENALNLKYNSYYLAGFSEDRIILGNSTAPLHGISLSRNLKDTIHFKIKLKGRKDYTFRALKLKVVNNSFLLYDGSVPVIYRGNIKNWVGVNHLGVTPYFSTFTPASPNHYALRIRSSESNENELGFLNLPQKSFKINSKLLHTQKDGVFDTDGTLRFNPDLQVFVYTYYYRNQFIVTDSNLKLKYLGKTIDTVTKVDYNLKNINSESFRTFDQKPLMINNLSYASGNYLFINSNQLGRYESKKMLTQASIIDTYNLKDIIYELSFYVYHHKKKPLREFQINDGTLVGLMDNYIVTYKLKTEYFEF